MSDRTIYALKVHETYREKVFASLKAGEARYGWSNIKTADLRELEKRQQAHGWGSLTAEEQHCYQNFLLGVKPEDYVVYVNVPRHGECTAARVTAPYFWRWEDQDFNHRLGCDPSSVVTFHRNDAAVHPDLSQRLKLRGRKWRIKEVAEFESLLAALREGAPSERRTAEHQEALLAKELTPHLNRIAEVIHHTHPNFSLEKLLERVFSALPEVEVVHPHHGRGDHGADLEVVTNRKHPLTGEIEQKVCVVQVKSHSGTEWSARAVEDIARAFARYPDADEGLIVSTATDMTEEVEQAIAAVEEEWKRPVYVLLGRNLAAFLLREAWDILGGGEIG
jgi:hypothetical protein